MIINNNDVNLNDVINLENLDYFLFKRRDNGFLFNDYQIDVLNRNGLNYKKYSNMHELLFDIEELLNEEYDSELDIVSNQIAELLYYSETKK